jgi:hypothetical protein
VRGITGGHIRRKSTECRAFLGQRRGERSEESEKMLERRDGGLKMDRTKPLHRRRAMGIESAEVSTT